MQASIGNEKSKISTETLFLVNPGRGRWSALGTPLTQLGSIRVSSLGVWKSGWGKEWIHLVNQKVRNYELFTANHPPGFFLSRKKKGKPISEGKTKQADKQRVTNKMCRRNQESQENLFIIHSWVLKKPLPLKFTKIPPNPAIKYDFHLL